MEYLLIKTNDYDYVVECKLKTVLEYCDSLTEEEINRINDYVKETISKDLPLYKLILVDNKKVGCVLIKEIDDGKMLDELYIEKEYRNHKIGSNIIKSIQDDNVYLWVYKQNEKAIKLYKKLNFEVIDETKTRYFMKYTR